MTEQRPRRKPGPKPATSKPAETKEEREQRNYLIFARFIAGHSEWDIGRSVGLSGPRVHQIIKAELKNAARHRQLLTDEALGIYVARLETLLKACWPKVLQQDLKAIEVARRLMESQARLYDLEEERVGAIPPMGEQELLSDDNPANLDELTKFRMQRGRRTGTESGES
jgi:hypothetical protein